MFQSNHLQWWDFDGYINCTKHLFQMFVPFLTSLSNTRPEKLWARRHHSYVRRYFGLQLAHDKFYVTEETNIE